MAGVTPDSGVLGVAYVAAILPSFCTANPSARAKLLGTFLQATPTRPSAYHFVSDAAGVPRPRHSLDTSRDTS